jgi:hypothetical protein
MKQVAGLLGTLLLALLASSLGCGTSPGNPAVDAGTQIGTFSFGTATFSGAFTGTDQAIAFADYNNFVGAVPSDGGTFVYLQLCDSSGVNGRYTGPSYFCDFTFSGTLLQPGHYTPADVIGYSCGVIFETDAGVDEFWTQSTFALDITATGPLLGNDGGIPYWPIPTVSLSAQLVAVDELNPTDAGLSFTATVAPPDCTNAPSYACSTH